ncbi:MAG: PAS domain S-box protein [Salinisphaeraceae bacterium]|nr:PAS domain S-box protein [Salinisphaeraceae bacterium]
MDKQQKQAPEVSSQKKADEMRLRAVIDAAPNAMVMVDETGSITLVNKQAENLFGYSREQLLSMSVDALVPERFRGSHEGFRKGFLSSPDTRAMGAGRDLYGLRADGTEVPIEIGLKPLKTDGGLFVLASIIDITERKNTEESFRLMVEAAPNAMLMVDRQGYITHVNAQAEKLFGYPREELLGEVVEKLVPDNVRAKHPSLRDSFFASPEARFMGVGRDLYGVTKDGREVPIEIGLNPIETPKGLLTLASIIDITERKRSEERLRLMVEAAPNAMIMANAQGIITQVNQQTERLFEYERHELLGHPIEMLVPKSVRAKHPEMRDSFFAAPEARSMGAGRDLYGVTKTGREIPLEIGLNPIDTPEGVITLASIIDISERKQAELLKRQEHDNLLRQSIFDSIPFSVIALDTDGRVIAVNPATMKMLGYSRDEIIGANAASLFHDSGELQQHAISLSRELGEKIPADHNAIVAKASRGMRDESEWTYRRKDGLQIPIHLTVTPLKDEAGKITGYLKVAYDITERKRTEAYIMHMAHHDPLTGLPNRLLLMDRIEMAIKQAHRDDKRVGVLLMDLDHFKRVNDSLGHHIGDQLLISISRRLQSSMRESDSLARLGGDEFVLVIPNVSSREKLESVVEMIFSSVTSPITLDNNELLITPSIGGSIYPDDGEDANILIRNADAAMYAAKASGRSNIQWFSEEMLQQNKEKLTLMSALMPAIENEEFMIHYQPEVALESGVVSGVEALIRWHHKELGNISPVQFIPLAEETGMILPIGEWVLNKACADVANLSQEIGRPLTLAVNVSPRQLQQVNWLEQVTTALESSGLAPEQLELEITEGTLIENPDKSAELLRVIQEKGIKVVIDDFGTGYSSLSYLTRFPIDKIKIDRSFIRDLHTDVTDAAVVEAIIAMAHSLNIRVVAEGVETAEQLTFLRERDCEEAQGYYFSPAVPMTLVPGVLEDIDP